MSLAESCDVELRRWSDWKHILNLIWISKKKRNWYRFSFSLSLKAKRSFVGIEAFRFWAVSNLLLISFFFYVAEALWASQCSPGECWLDLIINSNVKWYGTLTSYPLVDCNPLKLAGSILSIVGWRFQQAHLFFLSVGCFRLAQSCDP